MDTVIVTSGKYRGRKILTPGPGTHPMGSREKLALFNMLTGKIEGATVLDAFAGSGALGIEALSRGAFKVVFVDNSKKATEVISKNLATLGIKDNFEIIKSSVQGTVGSFDVILADPPYDNFNITDAEHLTSLLKNGGIMVLSHPGEAPELTGLTLLKTHQYAAAHLSIYAND